MRGDLPVHIQFFRSTSTAPLDSAAVDAAALSVPLPKTATDAELRAVRRNVGYVFQNSALFDSLTVAENLWLAQDDGSNRRTVAACRGEAEELVRRVNLDTAVLGKYPGELSGGQRQRVAIGRALVRDADVFLFDEPLSNLDAALRVQMRMEIAQLKDQLPNTTMVYVTHDQVEAMTLGQRIVVLKDGQIQQIDTPMALYEKPANLFVAGFLGSPAMNVLRGELTCGERPSLTLDGGAVVPLAHAQLPEAWQGRTIVIGVRPEHLQPSWADDAGFEARVESIEPVRPFM